MDKIKVKEITDLYLSWLKISFTPNKLSDINAAKRINQIPDGAILEHLTWMATQIQAVGQADAKTMRWLGFLQGVMWMRGYYSLDDLKNHSRNTPEDDVREEFVE